MMKRLLPLLLILVGCSHSHTRNAYDGSLMERLENSEHHLCILEIRQLALKTVHKLIAC